MEKAIKSPKRPFQKMTSDDWVDYLVYGGIIACGIILGSAGIHVGLKEENNINPVSENSISAPSLKADR